MQLNDDPLLTSLQVKTADRQYQVWERNSLSIDLYSEAVFVQKLNYIHNNPIQPKWNLAQWPAEYPWSSAGLYETGSSPFSFFTHYRSWNPLLVSDQQGQNVHPRWCWSLIAAGVGRWPTSRLFILTCRKSMHLFVGQRPTKAEERLLAEGQYYSRFNVGLS